MNAIYWKQKEKAAVLARGRQLIADGITRTQIELWKLAQRALPKKRRRVVYAALASDLAKLAREEVEPSKIVERAPTKAGINKGEVFARRCEVLKPLGEVANMVMLAGQSAGDAKLTNCAAEVMFLILRTLPV